ncbi:hypothetical protein YC2023_115626 [Brassica napus]
MVVEHKYLMELCLEHHNAEAHYIEGINQYFFHNNRSKALDYLRQSAQGKHDKGTYFYGLLLLCNENLNQGKKILDTLKWEQTLTTSNSCGRKIKKIKKVPSDYRITLEDMYLTNMDRLIPPPPPPPPHPPKETAISTKRNICARNILLFKSSDLKPKPTWIQFKSDQNFYNIPVRIFQTQKKDN